MTAIGCASRRKPLKKRVSWSCTMVWRRDVVVPFALLRQGRQLALQQQIAHLQEVALLRQLLDRVAAVQQHALVAVDVGDGGLAARRGHEARGRR